MRLIRIHNDISFKWSLTNSDGSAYDMSEKKENLSLFLRSGSMAIPVTDFEVDGNVLSWTFYGKDQYRTGRYDAVLCENTDGKMVTVDSVGVVYLVRNTFETGGEDGVGIETYSVGTASSIWGHEVGNVAWLAEPHMVIDTDGDYFLDFGEKMNVICSVFKGFADITSQVEEWKVTRDSGDEAEDAAWALKDKVKNFDGTLEIAFTKNENDLSLTKDATKFNFTAYLPDNLSAHFTLSI